MKMGFGSHRDKHVEEVPVDYLRNFYMQTPDLMRKRPDLTEEVKKVLGIVQGGQGVAIAKQLPRLNVSGAPLFNWLHAVAASGRLQKPAVTIHGIRYKWTPPYNGGSKPSPDDPASKVLITKHGSRFPNLVRYAHILCDGVVELRTVEVEKINEIVRLLSADDMYAYIAEAGKNSGNCCYCNKELIDPKSVSAGYGPVCAKNWGLKW